MVQVTACQLFLARLLPESVVTVFSLNWTLRSIILCDSNQNMTALIQENAWWRHQMQTISALLSICAGNSPVPVTGEFPAQRPVTRSFDVFFHLCLNKRLSKQSWGWWLETPSRPLWRCCNVFCDCAYVYVISCVLIVWFYTVKMDAIQSFHPACTFTWQLEAHDYGRAVTE